MMLATYKHTANGGRIITASPRKLGLREKLILTVVFVFIFIFSVSRCQVYAKQSQSADAQWALNNLSLAQQAYFEAHKSYAIDYERLARFGFQKYDNIDYSLITVYNDDQENGRPLGWRAQVKYKSRQAVTYTYDSLQGGFLDLMK